MKSKKSRLKKFPPLKTNEAAEQFVATADLTKYDLSGMVPVRFEFMPKTERVNMRLPEDLLNSVKDRAAHEGVPYQRYIRLALERAVTAPKRSKAKARL
jgi:predicted DNA binding CopG/RHH family protein